MKKSLLCICLIFPYVIVFSQISLDLKELESLKKKELLSKIYGLDTVISKLCGSENLSPNNPSFLIDQLERELRNARRENNKTASEIVDLRKQLKDLYIDIASEKMFFKELQAKKDSLRFAYQKDSIAISTHLDFLKKNNYLVYDDINQSATMDGDILKLLEVGKSYLLIGYCAGIQTFLLDPASFKPSQARNVFSVIIDNKSPLPTNEEKTSRIIEFQRMTDKAFKFRFSDGKEKVAIIDEEESSSSYDGRNLIRFLGKDGYDSDFQINFHYLPYSGLFADDMRIIRK